MSWTCGSTSIPYGRNVPDFDSHDERIAAVDEAVGVHIGAEVSGIGYLTRTIARLQRIARVHKLVASGVTKEDAHGDIYAASIRTIADSEQVDGEGLRIAHVAEGYCYLSVVKTRDEGNEAVPPGPGTP